MNNQQEFMSLVTLHNGIINHICNVYRPNEYAEEDLKQDILTEAWKSFKNFRGDCKFSTWLYTIAKNTAITKLRKLRARLQTVSLDNPFYQIELAEKEGEDDLLRKSLEIVYRTRLKYIFNNLTDDECELVVMYCSGFSYDEMAEKFGMDPNHLRVKIHRIKERMYKKFSKKPPLSIITHL
jgi:RNA polymerase sigma factor (sigma-70 family)